MPTTNFTYNTAIQWPDVTTNTVYYTNAITPTATINTTATGTTTTWAVPAAWANITANGDWITYTPTPINDVWHDAVNAGEIIKEILYKACDEIEEPEESEIIELLGE